MMANLPPSLLIDGHNLIGRMPGMSLRMIDDELHLIELLQTYARTHRKRIEVYFDGAPPGQAGERPSGAIRAIFVPLGRTADSAIRDRLAGLGRSARNTTVVSSDRQVQAEARARGANVFSSDDFATQLMSAWRAAAAAKKPATSGRSTSPGHRAPRDSGPLLSEKEVQEWMDLFQKGKKDSPGRSKK